MMRYPGYLLLLLALVSAVAMLVAPFEFVPLKTSGATWLLFPILLCAGFLFAALGARPGTIGKLFAITGAVLMILGCTAALVLVAASLGVLKPVGSVVSVWFILIAGIVLGALALSARGQRK